METHIDNLCVVLKSLQTIIQTINK